MHKSISLFPFKHGSSLLSQALNTSLTLSNSQATLLAFFAITSLKWKFKTGLHLTHSIASVRFDGGHLACYSISVFQEWPWTDQLMEFLPGRSSHNHVWFLNVGFLKSAFSRLSCRFCTGWQQYGSSSVPQRVFSLWESHQVLAPSLSLRWCGRLREWCRRGQLWWVLPLPHCMCSLKLWVGQ